MKRLRIIGLSLLALFAVGAVTAAAASAEEGFLPLINKEATVVGKKATLNTAANTPFICQEIDLPLSVIKFTNDKHATGTLHFLKCTTAGLSIISLGDGKEEVLVPALFLVCLNPETKEGKVLAAFGIAAEVEKIHLEVPALGILIEVNGRVIGTVLTAGPAKEYAVDFTGATGKQEAVKCKEGANVKEHTLTSETNHKTPETASENVEGGKVEFKEEVKLMDE